VTAALYHRVSTLDQNPTLAREQLRQAAAARGFEVVMDVEETGSGANNDRPGLQRVMDAARFGRIKAVVVYKLDRFGRSALDLLANIQDLEKHGCRFVAASQGIDISANGDPMSRFMLTILAGVAEFERELIRERTRMGMDRASKQGTRSGRPIGRPRVAVDVERARALFNASDGSASWSSVARALGISRGVLQQAMKEVLLKGVSNPFAKVEESGGQSGAAGK
jgi:putative DNA-invertase from lambdoid prophage Rac